MKTHSVGAEVLRVDRRTDGQTDMTMLIVFPKFCEDA